MATLTEGGILSVADLATGDDLGKARLDGSYAATPAAVVGDDGAALLICPNKGGAVAVVAFAADGSPEVLATNELGGPGFWAGPAVIGDALFLRDDPALRKIAGGE